MGIDRLDQPEGELAQQLAVAIDLLQHGIEDQRLAAGAACQQIAVGSRNDVEQLTKDHGWRGLDLISDNTAYSSAMASSFETHRFAMLLRMRSQSLMERSAATPRVSNHETLLGPNIAPALFLQFHQADDAGGNDDGVRYDGDRMAFGLLQALLGVVAGRKLDLAGEDHILQPLDAILHG